jgi:hypothetical protein
MARQRWTALDWDRASVDEVYAQLDVGRGEAAR